jgi:hypothetical protein
VTDLLDLPLAPDAPEPVAVDTDPTPPVEQPVPAKRATPRAPRSRREWFELVSTIVVVAGASLYVLAQLHPNLILTNTTPAGGDFGAHVWGPAYLRDHILPHGRLSGWAPDWYAGFPMYQFYMVVPALIVVALDVIVPYGIALKLVHVLGMVTLPVCCWAFGKLAGLKFPIPQLFAVAAVFFLFDETFTIYGGNIASTMAGEFSFSIALSLAMLFLGLFAYGMRTGRCRALAAVVFALCALCHLIVAFFAIIGAVLLFLFWADRRRFVYALGVGIVGALLTAFWILPFWYRGAYVTDMFYERRVDFWVMFFPQSRGMDWLINGLALIGLVGAVVRRYRAGAFLGAITIFYAVWARFWPQSHLWNARLLPFFYLTRYLLVAMGVVEVGRAVGRFVSPGSERADWRARAGTLCAVVPLSVLLLGLHLQNLPGLKQYYDNSEARWEYGLAGSRLGVRSKPAFVDDWAKWNYSGYENKSAYGEYYGIVQTMKDLGETRGCGRAMWENNNVQDRYGTPMALMLLPFWTDGCIGSMEGLFFEASGTTPYHFLATSALSERSSNPVRRLHYEDGQVDKGVEYLKKLGVRYYLAFNESVIAKADLNPSLVPVGQSGPWKVYEVQGTELVTPLDVEPVVVTGQSGSPFGGSESRDKWLEIGTSWFQDSGAWTALPAASGPSSWQRVGTEIVPDGSGNVRQTDDRYLATVRPDEPLERRELPEVTVSDVETSDDGISFKVDKVGVPVLVRASYFPNWEASGAEGPYRVAPNFMVVVPTSNEVTLSYGTTPIDWLAYFLTFLGLVGVVVLWRQGRVRYGDEADEDAVTIELPDLFLDWDEPFGDDLREPEPDTVDVEAVDEEPDLETEPVEQRPSWPPPPWPAPSPDDGALDIPVLEDDPTPVDGLLGPEGES